MQQDHLRRAGRLGEVVGRQADAPLGRGQVQGVAHRARQERIDRRALGPDALLQPGQHQAVGADQAGFDGAQDLQARVGGAGGAHHLAGHHPLQRLGEAVRGVFGQALALADQGGHQRGGGFPRRSGP